MKIIISTFDAEKVRQMARGKELAQKNDKKQALDMFSLEPVAEVAQKAEFISVSQSLPNAPGASSAKIPTCATAPLSARSSYIIPPNPLMCEERKGVRGISIKRSGSNWRKFKEAYGSLRQKTSILPGWAKRRCRRQAIAIFDRFWKAGEEQFFDQLRDTVKDWKKTPWNSLPADLPRKAGETSNQWLDRCYKAVGFAILKNITIGGRK